MSDNRRPGNDSSEERSHRTESRRLHGCHSGGAGQKEGQPQLLRIVILIFIPKSINHHVGAYSTVIEFFDDSSFVEFLFF